jgi:hypothetical protein
MHAAPSSLGCTLEASMTSRLRTNIIVAALGAATGFLTFVQLTEYPDFLRVSTFAAGLSIIPGVLFGALLAAISFRAGAPSPLGAIVTIVVTTFAWVAATDAGTFLGASLERPLGSPLNLVIAGLAGGFVGGLLTVLGVAAANARFRNVRRMLVTIIVATALGPLLALGGDQMERLLWVLFMAWQAAVAVSVNEGLSPAS